MEQKSTEQQQAQNLYFQTEFTQQQIAGLLNVNRKTLYAWIKEGNWKRAKYVAKHAPCILAEQYLGQLGALNNMIAQRTERPYPTKEEADIMRKIAMTHKNIKANRKSVSDNIELFTNFTQELRLDSVKTAQEFMPYMDKYIQTLIKEGSGLDDSWKTYLKDRAEDQEYEEWLSQQPKPEFTPTTFPPGYFTNDYQAQEVNTGVPSDATPTDPDITSLSPLDVTLPAPLEKAGVRPAPAGPNSQPPIPNSQTENGVSNGVSATPESTLNPLPVNTSAENDNADLSTKEEVKCGEVMREDEAEVVAAKSDRWSKFLEENYKISEDPYVIRKNGITVIKRGSPLWGRSSSLFFK